MRTEQQHSKHSVTGYTRPCCWEAVGSDVEQREDGQGQPHTQEPIFRGTLPRSRGSPGAGNWSKAHNVCSWGLTCLTLVSLGGDSGGMECGLTQRGTACPLQQAVGKKQHCGPIVAT